MLARGFSRGSAGAIPTGPSLPRDEGITTGYVAWNDAPPHSSFISLLQSTWLILQACPAVTGAARNEKVKGEGARER